jgi:hypothetical protein
MNRLTWTLLATLLAATAASVVCVVFETPFAEASIDWLAFFAGFFLTTEGLYKLIKYRKGPFHVQLCRFLRIFIGANVFLVHLAEFIWGPHAPAQTSILLGTIIDWAAFSFGIFLMIEGTIGLAAPDDRTRLTDSMDQITRAMRVVIGSSIFTIHLLQFMRY